MHSIPPQVLLRYLEWIGRFGKRQPALGTVSSSDCPPYPSLDGDTGVCGESDTTMRIEVQHGLPQTNTPFLQQVFVGHATASLPSQDDVHQALVLAYQTIQADLAPTLGTDVSVWLSQID